MGVLIDVGHARAVVGTPALLRSTFVRLMYLGEAPGSPFEKVDERRAAGERIVTWRVRYGLWDANTQTVFDFLSDSDPLNGTSAVVTSTVAPGNLGVPEASLIL
jgi:hypothetical protein